MEISLLLPLLQRGLRGRTHFFGKGTWPHASNFERSRRVPNCQISIPIRGTAALGCNTKSPNLLIGDLTWKPSLSHLQEHSFLWPRKASTSLRGVSPAVQVPGGRTVLTFQLVKFIC